MPEKKDNIKFWLTFRPFVVSCFFVSKNKYCFHVGEINNEIDNSSFVDFFSKTKKPFNLRRVMHYTSERLAK